MAWHPWTNRKQYQISPGLLLKQTHLIAFLSKQGKTKSLETPGGEIINYWNGLSPPQKKIFDKVVLPNKSQYNNCGPSCQPTWGNGLMATCTCLGLRDSWEGSGGVVSENVFLVAKMILLPGLNMVIYSLYRIYNSIANSCNIYI